MKRGTAILEPWSTQEKLCLSSAVLKSGEQNWMSVSRLLKVFGDTERPLEWYSQKQCALQYEALLNNVGTPKRKKRSEKGSESPATDTPSEIIVRKLLQERKDELHRLLEEDRREYMRTKKEMEDIENGLADDRLDEFEREIEEEKEKEATRGSILRQHEERSRLEGSWLSSLPDPPPAPAEMPIQPPDSKVPTSPLLTSLLQSPSHYRGGAIHSLLHPPPLITRANDSPTLSRLLESPAKQIEPTVLFTSPVKREPIEESTSEVVEPTQPAESSPTAEAEAVNGEVEEDRPALGSVKTEDKEDTPPPTIDQRDIEVVDDMTTVSEMEVEICANDVNKPVTLQTHKIESEEPDGEKEEHTTMTLSNLQDSDTMEDPQTLTELDRQTVNMIVGVAGGGVISVIHDTSSEHLEEVTSSDIQHKDDSEAAESVKEDSLDDVSEEAIKEVEAGVGVGIENDSCPSVEVDNFIIGPETPKENYVVQLLCSTPENLDEDVKTPEAKEKARTEGEQEKMGEVDEETDLNLQGAVLEVGGEMVNLGGAVVVEEEVDTTVHEVEVVVSEVNSSSSGGRLEDEDSTQDGEGEMKGDTPDTELQDDSQEDDDATKTSNEENDRDDKDEEKSQKEASTSTQASSRIADLKPESPVTEEEGEGGRRPGKKRLISGSVCSDSKPNSPASHMLEDSKEYRSWKKSIMLVYNRLATHKFASIFLRPITNEQAPAYDTVIHRPVDLSTIKKRIETGELRTTVEFQRDLLLMFQNAIMYNNCRTHVYEMASIMQSECMQHIELMVDAMGEGVPWRKDSVNEDKLHTRGRGEGRGEAPKRKRTAADDLKTSITPKRRKDASI